MKVSISTRFMAAVAVVALAGCGGGSSTSSTAASPAAKATTEAMREQGALPMANAMAMPKDMNCGAVKPVWVNLNTKAYHTSDDPYYGKTKNGKYECPSAAVTDGYHAAGAMHRHMKKGSAMSSDTSTP